jgi:thiosulfate/3-mercaptopyruvate sulfurtransferase
MMTLEHLPVLVDAAWLARHLTTPGLRIVDASWSMGGSVRFPRDTYEAGHIPGAVFLDLDTVAEPGSSLPHTLATARHFGSVVGSSGIGNDDAVVIYDQAGMHTSPRAWWLFKAYGHDRVAVLDGGFLQWRASGAPVDRQPVVLPPRAYLAADPWAHACTSSDVLHASQTGAPIVDARSAGRFRGDDPEPRPGLRSGHIPGSRNLPYTALLDPHDGKLLDVQRLRQVFQDANVDLDSPIICTCGSGVTACVIRLALARLGASSARVYDGSWTEWGSDPALPIATGP